MYPAGATRKIPHVGSFVSTTMLSPILKPFAVFSPMIQCLLLLWSGQAAHADDGLRVVVSIKPIHSLVAGVTRGAIEPELLVQGEASPYDYALSEEQARALPDSDLLIWVGPELEAFLRRSGKGAARAGQGEGIAVQ